MNAIRVAIAASVLLAGSAYAGDKFLSGQPGGSGHGAYTDQRGCCVNTGGNGEPTYTGNSTVTGHIPTGNGRRFGQHRDNSGFPNTGGVRQGDRDGTGSGRGSYQGETQGDY